MQQAPVTMGSTPSTPFMACSPSLMQFMPHMQISSPLAFSPRMNMGADFNTMYINTMANWPRPRNEQDQFKPTFNFQGASPHDQNQGFFIPK